MNITKTALYLLFLHIKIIFNITHKYPNIVSIIIIINLSALIIASLYTQRGLGINTGSCFSEIPQIKEKCLTSPFFANNKVGLENLGLWSTFSLIIISIYNYWWVNRYFAKKINEFKENDIVEKNNIVEKNDNRIFDYNFCIFREYSKKDIENNRNNKKVLEFNSIIFLFLLITLILGYRAFWWDNCDYNLCYNPVYDGLGLIGLSNMFIFAIYGTKLISPLLYLSFKIIYSWNGKTESEISSLNEPICLIRDCMLILTGQIIISLVFLAYAYVNVSLVAFILITFMIIFNIYPYNKIKTAIRKEKEKNISKITKLIEGTINHINDIMTKYTKDDKKDFLELGTMNNTLDTLLKTKKELENIDRFSSSKNISFMILEITAIIIFLLPPIIGRSPGSILIDSITSIIEVVMTIKI